LTEIAVSTHSDSDALTVDAEMALPLRIEICRGNFLTDWGSMVANGLVRTFQDIENVQPFNRLTVKFGHCPDQPEDGYSFQPDRGFEATARGHKGVARSLPI
jgi:hypothetical protein